VYGDCDLFSAFLYLESEESVVVCVFWKSCLKPVLFLSKCVTCLVPVQNAAGCIRILFSVCECVTADLCLVTGGRFSSARASPILAISIGDAIDTSHLSCEICKQLPHDTSLLGIMLPGAPLCVSRICQIAFKLTPFCITVVVVSYSNDMHRGKYWLKLL
jgi:hypothetical protein